LATAAGKKGGKGNCGTGRNQPVLPLALLMSGLAADYPHDAVTLDYLALSANSLH